jgi:phosphoglycolate phosphatase
MALSHLTFSAVARGSLPVRALASAFDAIIFDKDGTLLDFEATWNPAIRDGIVARAGGDAKLQATIASTLGFDMATARPLKDAPVIHKSGLELQAMLDAKGTDGRAVLDACADRVLAHITAVPSANAVLSALQSAGIPCAVATNDEQVSTEEQLRALGWLEPANPLISAVLCCDSGHGSKPEPGMVLAAVAALGVDPARCAMIGDAAADMKAGRSAGVAASILVGPADAVGQHAGLADLHIRELGELLREPFG